MFTSFVILLILAALIIIYSFIKLGKDNIIGAWVYGAGTGMLLTVAIISFVYYIVNVPPIEVYRGNTTLQVTYKDSVPVDSVVVYKSK